METGPRTCVLLTTGCYVVPVRIGAGVVEFLVEKLSRYPGYRFHAETWLSVGLGTGYYADRNASGSAEERGSRHVCESASV